MPQLDRLTGHASAMRTTIWVSVDLPHSRGNRASRRLSLPLRRDALARYALGDNWMTRASATARSHCRHRTRRRSTGSGDPKRVNALVGRSRSPPSTKPPKSLRCLPFSGKHRCERDGLEPGSDVGVVAPSNAAPHYRRSERAGVSRSHATTTSSLTTMSGKRPGLRGPDWRGIRSLTSPFDFEDGPSRAFAMRRTQAPASSAARFSVRPIPSVPEPDAANGPD